MKQQEACLVCGEALQYFEHGRELECVSCHRKLIANAACKAGHYVCDRCHAERATDHVLSLAQSTASKNPLAIASEMMRDPYVHMHGPEHHVLVGAALLAAYENAGGALDRPAALAEMKRRGAQIPGGACGFFGCCGAAVSAGIFVSLATGATPMATDAFGLSNRMTAAALSSIGALGGPRCCKRDSFLAIERATAFCAEFLHVQMDAPDAFVCAFYPRNRECLGKRCPFHPAAQAESARAMRSSPEAGLHPSPRGKRRPPV